MSENPRPVENVEVEQFQNSPPSVNPVAGALDIQLSVPENIEIKMVHADALNDYEVLVFIAGLLGSAFTGFLVAFVQSCPTTDGPDWALFWMTFVWLVLFLVVCWMSIRKRRAMRKSSKSIRLKATQVQVKDANTT